MSYKFACIEPRPSTSTRLPYTTLFRSVFAVVIMQQVLAMDQKTRIFHRRITRHLFHPLLMRMTCDSGQAYPPALQMNEKQRSEEHTSELQSRRDLVCRLLLEKKN